MPRIGLFLFFTLAIAIAAKPPDDTKHLAASLKGLRGWQGMNPAEYRRLQNEYLEWIDRRVSKGVRLGDINREIRRISNQVDPSIFWVKASHAGVLEDLQQRNVRGADDLVAIVAGIGVGGSCSIDDTVILYERASMHRVGWVNGDSKSEGHFYVTGVAANRPAPGEPRIIASGWDTSNCTSTWNGKAICIHQAKADALVPILETGVTAWTGNRPETIAPYVERNEVYFWYDGGVFFPDVLVTPSVSKYRIEGGHVTRVAPLALTVAGFIYQWLGLPGDEVSRWSLPPAANAHQAMAETLRTEVFDLDSVAICQDQGLEVTLTPTQTKRHVVFKILGNRAKDLQMAAVSRTPNPACIPISEPQAHHRIFTELRW